MTITVGSGIPGNNVQSNRLVLDYPPNLTPVGRDFLDLIKLTGIQTFASPPRDVGPGPYAYRKPDGSVVISRPGSAKDTPGISTPRREEFVIQSLGAERFTIAAITGEVLYASRPGERPIFGYKDMNIEIHVQSAHGLIEVGDLKARLEKQAASPLAESQLQPLIRKFAELGVREDTGTPQQPHGAARSGSFRNVPGGIEILRIIPKRNYDEQGRVVGWFDASRRDSFRIQSSGAVGFTLADSQGIPFYRSKQGDTLVASRDGEGHLQVRLVNSTSRRNIDVADLQVRLAVQARNRGL